jgi:hypothetical protein
MTGFAKDAASTDPARDALRALPAVHELAPPLSTAP